jgi:hypothetical protein
MNHAAAPATVDAWGTLEEVSAFLFRKHSKLRRSNGADNVKYRGVEYTVVQGIGRGVWKWSASVEGVVVTGKTRSAAVTAAEKAIDRALVGRTGPPLQPD